MKYHFLILLFLFSIEPVKSQIQSDPKLVVLELFKAAQTGDHSKLSGLCDPYNKCDRDVKMICNLQNAPESDKTLFNELFKVARIAEEPIIQGEFAKVKIKYGKIEDLTETIVLVRRNKLWYLFGF